MFIFFPICSCAMGSREKRRGRGRGIFPFKVWSVPQCRLQFLIAGMDACFVCLFVCRPFLSLPYPVLQLPTLRPGLKLCQKSERKKNKRFIFYCKNSKTRKKFSNFNGNLWDQTVPNQHEDFIALTYSVCLPCQRKGSTLNACMCEGRFKKNSRGEIFFEEKKIIIKLARNGLPRETAKLAKLFSFHEKKYHDLCLKIFPAAVNLPLPRIGKYFLPPKNRLRETNG